MVNERQIFLSRLKGALALPILTFGMFGAYFSETFFGGAIDTGAIDTGASVGVANVASPERRSPEQLSADHNVMEPIESIF